MKTITIRDVAKKAGVSEAAVSYCLNRVPGQISRKTEERIRRAVADLNYVPSSPARCLALGRTDLFGVVTVNLLLEPFTEGLKGIEEAFRKHRVSILIGDAAGTYEREKEYANLLLHKGIEGLIFISASSEQDHDFLKQISDRIPVVLINRPFAPANFYRILLENRRPVRELVTELIRRGEKEIVYLSRPPETWAFSERLKGYQEAVEATGVKSCAVIFPDGEPENKREATIRSLLRPRRPCAFVCGNSRLATLVWKTAYQEGLRIPQDISLAGFDDTKELSLLLPPVTAIRQPFFEAGALAVDILMKLREGKRVKKEWKLESRILWRESVKDVGSSYEEVEDDRRYT